MYSSSKEAVGEHRFEGQSGSSRAMEPTRDQTKNEAVRPDEQTEIRLHRTRARARDYNLDEWHSLPPLLNFPCWSGGDRGASCSWYHALYSLSTLTMLRRLRLAQIVKPNFSRPVWSPRLSQIRPADNRSPNRCVGTLPISRMQGRCTMTDWISRSQ
jgi:hypothetical protein